MNRFFERAAKTRRDEDQDNLRAFYALQLASFPDLCFGVLYRLVWSTLPLTSTQTSLFGLCFTDLLRLVVGLVHRVDHCLRTY